MNKNNDKRSEVKNEAREAGEANSAFCWQSADFSDINISFFLSAELFGGEYRTAVTCKN